MLSWFLEGTCDAMQRFDGLLLVCFIYEPNENHIISKVKGFTISLEF